MFEQIDTNNFYGTVNSQSTIQIFTQYDSIIVNRSSPTFLRQCTH